MAKRRSIRKLTHIAILHLAAVVLFVQPSPVRAQGDTVQDCQPGQYVDRTAPSASRNIDWGFGIPSAPERCMRVQVGQTVVWHASPDFDAHPLGGSGGDTPNPIGLHQNGAVTFQTPGTYGFICLSHSFMKGAVNVVPAAPPPVPARSPWMIGGLVMLLAASGIMVMRRRALARP